MVGSGKFRRIRRMVNADPVRIFLICGLSTIATGIIAFIVIPKSPHHTGYLCGGLVPIRGWLSEREADIFIARIVKADPTKGQASTLKITLKDMSVISSQQQAMKLTATDSMSFSIGKLGLT